MKLETKHVQCFPAGTLVHTDKGLVPIQDIKVGDMVLSRPEWGGRDAPTEYKRVARAFCSGEDVIYRVIYIDNEENYVEGEKVKAKAMFVSEYHPVWIEDEKGWVAIRDLKEYEMILSSLDSNKSYTIVSAYPVFDIEISDVNLTFLKSLSPFEKIGHCMKENSRPDIDAILISTPKEIKVQTFESWGDVYDVSYEFKNISLELVDAINVTDISTSTSFFSTAVYNLEVEEFHTYFVGELGLWVGDSTIQGNNE